MNSNKEKIVDRERDRERRLAIGSKDADKLKKILNFIEKEGDFDNEILFQFMYQVSDITCSMITHKKIEDDYDHPNALAIEIPFDSEDSEED